VNSRGSKCGGDGRGRPYHGVRNISARWRNSFRCCHGGSEWTSPYNIWNYPTINMMGHRLYIEHHVLNSMPDSRPAYDGKACNQSKYACIEVSVTKGDIIIIRFINYCRKQQQ